jgi:hypothetical protein
MKVNSHKDVKTKLLVSVLTALQQEGKYASEIIGDIRSVVSGIEILRPLFLNFCRETNRLFLFCFLICCFMVMFVNYFY